MSRLSHIAVILPLKVILPTLKFFVDQLGFLVYFQTQDPLDYAVVKRDGITINLSLVEGTWQLPPNNRAYIYCEDIVALFKEYQDKGVPFREALNTTDYGMQEFVLEVPGGHRLVFGQGAPDSA
ncbi:MAG: hypothetical protein KTR30_27115 [Saprospiraceae bacterium]|nr:hypothetical protein [Saprospiraceae bacterium]